MSIQKLKLLFLFLLVLPGVLSAELITLNIKGGDTQKVAVDQYDPQSGVVTVRVNGTGSRSAIKLSDLDAPSAKRVKDWYLAHEANRMLRFDVNRIPGNADGTCLYEIEIFNSSDSPIEGLRAEYEVPMVERKQVQKVSTYTVKKNAGSNKNKKNQKRQRVTYKQVESRKVLKGEIKLGKIPVRQNYTVRSAVIKTQTVQVFGNSGKQVKARRMNEHLVKGMLLHIYSGNQLLRTVSSSPGVEQLVEQYR